jgi:hypothetical protein
MSRDKNELHTPKFETDTTNDKPTDLNLIAFLPQKLCNAKHAHLAYHIRINQYIACADCVEVFDVTYMILYAFCNKNANQSPFSTFVNNNRWSSAFW